MAHPFEVNALRPVADQRQKMLMSWYRYLPTGLVGSESTEVLFQGI